jgi:hypothetical protein
MASEISDKAAPLNKAETAGVGVGVMVPADAAAEPPRLVGLRQAFRGTVERLEQIIELETATLQQHVPVDLRGFNHKKSHGLLELTRALRTMDRAAFDQASLASLERLRGKLSKNLAVLESHLRAVRQVSGLIARAIEDGDSDGTYSATKYKSVPKI